jgi:chemotaxis family two-component system response regulator Rcp1
VVPGMVTLDILLVEDDPADRKLIKSMVEKQDMAHNLRAAHSAEEALDLLRSGENASEGFTRPDLIILDLNMPGMGGREFLKQIKTDENLRQIPVIILTCSTSERDILDSYELQAAGFITKPAGLADLERVVREAINYWSISCRLPCKEY